MRWKTNKEGDHRIRRKLIWWPRTDYKTGNVKWLEWEYVAEYYGIYHYCFGDSYAWCFHRAATKEEYDEFKLSTKKTTPDNEL